MSTKHKAPNAEQVQSYLEKNFDRIHPIAEQGVRLVNEIFETGGATRAEATHAMLSIMLATVFLETETQLGITL
jgi:hypothetical protein